MKVLICGGRDYDDKECLTAFLNQLHDKTPITQVIHGAAPGVDTLANEWAITNSIPVRSYPAQWRLYGKAAGPKRNKQMLDEGQPELVIAFPGGPGTANMVAQACFASLRVIYAAQARST